LHACPHIYQYYYVDVVELNNLWMAGLYGVLSGVVGTGAGGFLACFLPAGNRRVLSLLLEYSAGLMLAVVCFDLLPNAFRYAPLSAVLTGVLAGIFLMILSDGFSRTRHWNNRKNGRVKNTGMVIAFGIALHNFLEGMAVGSGFEAELTLGISLAVAIMLHDVPEGMSIAIPLRAGGARRTKAFALALASGLPMGLGAMFGAWTGKIAAAYISVSLAVAGGAMLYIVFVNMLPESKYIYGSRLSSFGGIAGMISGIIVSVKLG
jgi:ZIP family zinc transporter